MRKRSAVPAPFYASFETEAAAKIAGRKFEAVIEACAPIPKRMRDPKSVATLGRLYLRKNLRAPAHAREFETLINQFGAVALSESMLSGFRIRSLARDATGDPVKSGLCWPRRQADTWCRHA